MSARGTRAALAAQLAVMLTFAFLSSSRSLGFTIDLHVAPAKYFLIRENMMSKVNSNTVLAVRT
jgi:hypothetical protein